MSWSPAQRFIAALQRRLAKRPRSRLKVKEFRKAAVLVPLVERKGVSSLCATRSPLSIPLMKRADAGGPHSGQISFPGGQRESLDDDAVDTALRETSEEYGWQRDNVKVLGCLDDELTPSGYVVRPIVGHLPQEPRYSPDHGEVASIFHVPLDFLLDDRNEIKQTPAEFGGERYELFEYHFEEHRIWGLTARILHTLKKLSLRVMADLDETEEGALEDGKKQN